LWLAGCPQGRVLGHWFHPCGYCDDLQERVLAVPLPVELAPVGLLHCVPANVRCSS
jgi:hypothetical protein